MNSSQRVGLGTILALTLTIAATINLESTPPLWWDEGWNLSVARNWVELGHYGRLLAGEPTSPSMSTGFPAIAPVALSFRLLGVGIWQGRLIGVFFTFGALALIYYLATRLYNRPVAIATLVVLLLMSPHSRIHPILMGRQVLGEMPALFYLLAGYACFLSALHRPVWALPLTLFFWGAALITKLQVLPFWTASLLIPLLITLFQRRWKSVNLFLLAFLGSLISSQLMLWLQRLLVDSHTQAVSSITGLFEVTALLPLAYDRRLVALIMISMFGMPTLLGLCYETGKFVKYRTKAAPDSHTEVIRLALLALAGSWFAWYLLFSIGWVRYLFPATFIGSIFVATLLDDLTNHFSFSSTVKSAGHALRHLRFDQRSAGAVLAIVLIAMTFPSNLTMLYRSYVINADASAVQVVDFLNKQTAARALIETYASELFFLLERRYHYPPDQIHVDLNRRTFIDHDKRINYDPSAVDPDYLVVDHRSKVWRLYESLLASGKFRRIRTYGQYEVYERVR